MLCDPLANLNYDLASHAEGESDTEGNIKGKGSHLVLGMMTLATI